MNTLIPYIVTRDLDTTGREDTLIGTVVYGRMWPTRVLFSPAGEDVSGRVLTATSWDPYGATLARIRAKWDAGQLVREEGTYAA